MQNSEKKGTLTEREKKPFKKFAGSLQNRSHINKWALNASLSEKDF